MVLIVACRSIYSFQHSTLTVIDILHPSPVVVQAHLVAIGIVQARPGAAIGLTGWLVCRDRGT